MLFSTETSTALLLKSFKTEKKPEKVDFCQGCSYNVLRFSFFNSLYGKRDSL